MRTGTGRGTTGATWCRGCTTVELALQQRHSVWTVALVAGLLNFGRGVILVGCEVPVLFVVTIRVVRVVFRYMVEVRHNAGMLCHHPLDRAKATGAWVVNVRGHQ